MKLQFEKLPTFERYNLIDTDLDGTDPKRNICQVNKKQLKNIGKSIMELI